MKNKLSVIDDVILSKIYVIRNQKVMLDRDLAKLYGVETKYLKRQVRRNIKRFSIDFMFELNESEFKNWRSQFVTSNSSDKMGLRYSPLVFTEQGVAMLSSVLHSDKSIEVNIQIMRLFTKLRTALTDNLSLKIEVDEIKEKLKNHSKNIELIFNYLDELIEKKDKPRTKIGYKK